MAVIRCKMCGGTLEIREGVSVAVCEYCGTQQTLPRLDSERKAALYDRAGHFRRSNEYDKARDIYEQILTEDKTDAEAYWSLVLCRYGIEYVEDPATHKRIPTVNRAQFTAIFDDDNYRSALHHADSSQRAVYEAEAKAINEIQKGILAISQKEEPFDVFICYKETDNNGRRTPDSVLANDLYHQLTQEGFKVFFSRITLEDKLGQEYEPYIFAALNSARVMVVLGTKPEHFNAVWVRNEWSRYLALIRSGAKKILIPAYKDMDPYDLPEEFSHLQAQDMGKLGFMQDLIRGIRKLTQADEPKASIVKETVITSGSANAAPLLRRAFLFLEDGEWSSANEYCERVLDLDPENAEAYLGKLMAELHVKTQERLKDQAEPFDSRNNYQKAVRFANSELKQTLYVYIDCIKQRNETARRMEIYHRAQSMMASAKTEAAYKEAAELFATIPGWKDAEELSAVCQKRIIGIQQRTKRNRRIGIRATALICGVTAFFVLFDAVISPFLQTQKEEPSAPSEIPVVTAPAPTQKPIEVDEKPQHNAIKPSRGMRNTIAGGGTHLVAIKTDGTVVAAGDNTWGQCDVSGWCDVEAISASKHHTVGLKTDGTVAAAGYGKAGQCDVSNWVDIVAIAAGGLHTVGLKTDGTVVAVGDNTYGQCDVNNWTDIVDIGAGKSHTVGLKADGTVVAVGSLSAHTDHVSNWTDIAAIDASGNRTIGLHSDGTVVVIGGATVPYTGDWENMVAVTAAEAIAMGLKADGTVIAEGIAAVENLHKNEDWSDIVSIHANWGTATGLRGDGTMVTTADIDISGWIGIKLPASFAGNPEENVSVSEEEVEIPRKASATHSLETISAKGSVTAAVKTDGTVMVTAYSTHTGGLNKVDVRSWTDVVSIGAHSGALYGLRSDGTVLISGVAHPISIHNAKNWSDIVDITSNHAGLIGLRSDGTVVATGDSDVSDWADIVAVDGCVGLRQDGTLVAVDGWNNDYGQYDVANWTDIISVRSEFCCTVGLRHDGTVVAAGLINDGRCAVDGWSDIVAIETSPHHIIGLRRDGTVVAYGQNMVGQCNVEHWTDVAAIAAGINCTIGIRSDGTVLVAGNHYFSDANSWTDIVAVSADADYIAGLHSDGTMVTAGSNGYGQRNVDHWTDIRLPNT